jgi:hypothetical protein
MMNRSLSKPFKTRLRGAVFLFGLTLSAFDAAVANAATFTPEGDVVADKNAVLTLSFDDAAGVAGLTNGAGPGIEGKGYVVARVTTALIEIPLALPKQNGRYVARMFARKNRVRGSINASNPADQLAGFEAKFFPTGKVTSDGWYEIATAPFSLPANFEASLSILASGADVDAFEVVAEGTFKPLSSCELAGDSRCGAGEYCAARSCRNGDLEVPKAPSTEAKREELAAYLASRLRIFGGGRYTRENNLPKSLATIAAMKSAGSAWEFWNGFATALHQFRDWHTKSEGAGEVGGRGALPVCFVEGDADLSHATSPKDPVYPDVIVSHVGAQGNSGLKPGDRLVAVNGIHPMAFADSLENIDWAFWHANDPNGHAEAAERMRFMIRRWAKDITIIRCDAALATCGPAETIPVTALPDVEPNNYPECDHRPSYPISGPDPRTHRVSRVYDGAVAGEDRTWGIVWDSVLISDPASNPYKVPFERAVASADKIVLDHRTGNGGTELAAEYLTQAFRAPETLGVATGFGLTVDWFSPPFTPADGISLLGKLGASGDPFKVGSATARTDLRTALLLARDGSASDWFPLGMKNAGTNVRTFGRRTAGAFSSFLQLDYYGGLRFQFGSGDFIRNDGTTHIGEGVQPDEDILPKQSDLLVGKDTVLMRALEWLKTP